MVKVQLGHCPSSAPVPRQGAPDGLGPLGPLGAHRERPAHWAPRHGLEGSSSPPPRPPISPPFFFSSFFLWVTMQVARRKTEHDAHWTLNLPSNVRLQGVPEKKLKALDAWEVNDAGEGKDAPRQVEP